MKGQMALLFNGAIVGRGIAKNAWVIRIYAENVLDEKLYHEVEKLRAGYRVTGYKTEPFILGWNFRLKSCVRASEV